MPAISVLLRERVCGDNVDSVDLEFLNAAEYAPTSAPADDYALAASDLAAGSPSTVDYTAATVAIDPSDDDSAEAATVAADAPAEATRAKDPTAEGDDADTASDEAPTASASASASVADDAKPNDDAPEVEGSEITVPMARYAGRDGETTGGE